MLGDNFAVSTGRSLPGPVSSVPGFVDVQAGLFHFCAIRGPAPGTLLCWGRNSDSQLGNGGGADALVPVSVSAGSLTWLSVTAGERHTCGVTGANELWCWGSGVARANGFTITQSTPARVGSESDWTSVAAGYNHTCGIRSPGSLWCFGAASNGALGTGSTATTNIPGQVGTRTDWEFVTGGDDNTTAIRGGVRYIWGVSPASNLGTGVRWPGPVPSLASQLN
jgi:alpha-tubulin suppressor-like RCC1 family protein